MSATEAKLAEARQLLIVYREQRDQAERENEKLRGELSLAEEGLANYAQENARLKTACRLLWHYGQPTVPELRAEIIALAEIGDAPPSEVHPSDNGA